MNYINGYLNYTGNKFKLLEQIIPQMDYSKECFIDLFAGSFVVGANVVSLYKEVLANDIIKELVEIHKQLLESDDIIEKTKSICPSKDDSIGYNNLRNSFNLDKTPEKLWALMLSCNSNMIRFNKSLLFNQTWGKRQWNSSTDKKVEDFKNHIRKYKDKIKFTSNHFSKVEANKPSMVYIDPPYGYIIDNNTIGNKQISEAGYNCFWLKEDDISLYNYCLKLNKEGNSFMLSGVLEHNNKVSWLLNKLISDGFKCKILDCDYNKVSKAGDKATKEIIIMNY